MTLAAYTDANRYLDTNKLVFATNDDASPEATAADRKIRGKLFGVYGDVVDTWDIDPTSPQIATPNLIIEIAGMMMACQRYAKKYAEEVEAESSYAGRLCKEADKLIEQIIDGTIALEDTPSGIAFGQPDFWPNDTTVDIHGDPLRFATMEKEF